MPTLHLVTPPMTGATAIQRALASAGLLTAEGVDDEYGPNTAHACELAKFRLGYPKPEIPPGHETADATLLAYLRGKKKLPPDYLERRKARIGAKKDSFDAPSADEQGEAARRAEVVSEFRGLIAHEPQVHYAQNRPIPTATKRRTLPPGGIVTDCSGSIV